LAGLTLVHSIVFVLALEIRSWKGPEQRSSSSRGSIS